MKYVIDEEELKKLYLIGFCDGDMGDLCDDEYKIFLADKEPIEPILTFKREKGLNMQLAIWQLITDKTKIGDKIQIFIGIANG